MNDFVVEITTPAVISGNFEELQTELQNMMTAYAGLEVTEGNIPERKKDVATLRKIKAAIDDKRKTAKKAYEKPFKAFEDKCKRLTGIIDAEISRINKELSVYEQKRIDEKWVIIHKLYGENIGELENFIPLEQIFCDRWLNKTCSENDIVSDIQQAKVKVRTDLDAINDLCDGYIDECIAAYKKGGNQLQAAVARYNDLKSARERAEADMKMEEVKPLPTVEEFRKKMAAIPLSCFPAEQYTFTVFNSQDAQSVRAYLNTFEIKYEES